MAKKREAYIGVDLGGTSIQTAVVRDGKVLASSGKKTKPKRGPEGVIERIAETIQQVMKECDDTVGEFRAICVGAPGMIDPVAGMDSSRGVSPSARAGLTQLDQLLVLRAGRADIGSATFHRGARR